MRADCFLFVLFWESWFVFLDIVPSNLIIVQPAEGCICKKKDVGMERGYLHSCCTLSYIHLVSTIWYCLYMLVVHVTLKYFCIELANEQFVTPAWVHQSTRTIKGLVADTSQSTRSLVLKLLGKKRNVLIHNCQKHPKIPVLDITTNRKGDKISMFQ